MPTRMSNDVFAEKAKKIHGDKYDYSKVDYKLSRIPVLIVCKTCGNEFWQRPNDHLRGRGCSVCSHRLPLTNERFVARAVEVHGDRYSYDKANCQGWDNKVCITCNIHGDFWQTPSNHISCGKGCPTCAKEKNDDAKRYTRDEIIQKFIESKGMDFDYSKVEYVNLYKKVCIGCKKHGDFLISPIQFIIGAYGCPSCWEENRWRNNKKIYKEDFIRISRQTHGNKYGYDEVHFLTIHDKVKIYCPKHGYFEQSAKSHMNGHGCSKCKFSVGEQTIAKFLKDKKIAFMSQYKIPNEYILCSNMNIYVDFYIPSKKAIIEFNGAQHYRPVKWWGCEQTFGRQQERDESVRTYCKTHGLNLIEIPYTEYDNVEKILKERLNIK